MNSKPKKEIIVALAILVFVVVFINFSYSYEPFSAMTFFDNPMELNLDIPDDNFTRFALAVTIAYDMLPTIAQQFSISAITVQLLMTGFSPIILAVLSAIGLLAGQMILYLVGMVIRKVNKGSFGDIAGNNHFLHKYHFLIYFAVPFVGILGDGAMLYSGHQRINPIRIIPFLFLANLASTARWIVPTMAELEIADAIK
jgi:membrane protein YqaA with SNARE-associated domain